MISLRNRQEIEHAVRYVDPLEKAKIELLLDIRTLLLNLQPEIVTIAKPLPQFEDLLTKLKKNCQQPCQLIPFPEQEEAFESYPDRANSLSALLLGDSVEIDMNRQGNWVGSVVVKDPEEFARFANHVFAGLGGKFIICTREPANGTQDHADQT
jgi:hypothetical protein